MNELNGEEPFDFSEEEKGQTDAAPQAGGRESGVVGKFFKTVWETVSGPFKYPAPTPPDPDGEGAEADDGEAAAEEAGEFRPEPSAGWKTPERTEPRREPDTSSKPLPGFGKQVKTKGVIDIMDNNINSYYSKPVYTQRTLRERNQEELLDIVDKMRENLVVMLNLELCSEADLDHIITFLDGAASFQGGALRPSASKSYVLTPPNADIDMDYEPEPPRSSFLP